MPWLDTTSDTWTQLQYNISDNMLQSIKGQQIQLQATQEGNRILQNGVVSALLDDLAPTLQAIDANTVSEDSMGSAYKAVETLIDHVNKDVEESNKIINKYSPNRVARRDSKFNNRKGK